MQQRTRARQRDRGLAVHPAEHRFVGEESASSAQGTGRSTLEFMPAAAYRREGVRLPVPPWDLRPDLRAGHARHAVLHRLPQAHAVGAALVVGGGEIGLEKVEGLLACDGDVTVISPEVHPEVAQARAGGLGRVGAARVRRPRGPRGHLHGHRGDRRHRHNIQIYEDAERRAMLVNIVDVPPLCNFILPAIVRTGPLAIAISTAGASPALAKRMKRQIAEQYGEAYARARAFCSTRRAAGPRARCPPTRTARRSSRASSTAIPTRSSSWRAATTTAVRDLDRRRAAHAAA